jgi:hypothetical protein
MPVKEITDVLDAKKRITEYFGNNVPDVMEYAKFAYFLTKRDLVTPALEKVSAGVWNEYCAKPNVANRFTGAIIRYATKALGFKCQENVVFTGPLDDETFLSYVNNGVLWKDTFAPEHGEFSHTLQWLSGAKHIGWDNKTATYYKNSTCKSVKELATRINGATGMKEVPLWAWLVDCFPAIYSPGVNGKENIFSDTCRVPNNITKLAMEHAPKSASDKSAWFIGLYVKCRQTTTLQKAESEGYKDAIYEERSGPKKAIQAIKSYQTAHYEEQCGGNDARAWKAAGPVEKVTVSKIQKDVHRVFTRGTNLAPTKRKDFEEMEFHGRKGLVPKRIAASIKN